MFAPTDAAFTEYFETTKTTKEAFLVCVYVIFFICTSRLLSRSFQGDKEKLANILKYHVVDGITDGKALLTVGQLTTLNGQIVKAVIDKDRAFMNDECKVETTDVEADNGIFHIIDFPLTPPKK